MKEEIKMPQLKEKTSRHQIMHQKSHQCDKHLGCYPSKRLGTFVIMDNERTPTNGPELMNNHKALHPKYDIDRLYVSEKGGREIVSVEHCVAALIRKLKDFIKKSKKQQYG